MKWYTAVLNVISVAGIIFSRFSFHRTPAWHKVIIAAVFFPMEGTASAAFSWWLLKGLSQDVGGREEEKGSREGRILMTLHRFWSSVKLDWLGHTRRTDSFLGPGDANVPQIQPCHLVPYLMTLKEIVIERQFTSLQHILLEMAKKKRPSRYTAKLQNPFPSLSFSPLISCSLKLPHKSGLGSLFALSPLPSQAQLSGFSQFSFFYHHPDTVQEKKASEAGLGRKQTAKVYNLMCFLL